MKVIEINKKCRYAMINVTRKYIKSYQTNGIENRLIMGYPYGSVELVRQLVMTISPTLNERDKENVLVKCKALLHME